MINRIVVKLCVLFFLLLGGSEVAAQGPCFKYEPAIVELTGTIKRVEFPGPPNYESVKGGDEPEPYWVLFLSSAICVEGDPNSEFNGAGADVKSLQLNMDSYDKYRAFLSKESTIRGTLKHSITGHHHTEVLINVIEIKEPSQRPLSDGLQSRRSD